MSNKLDRKLDEIIRVDHAGEMGAKVIYSGQIAAMKLRGEDKEILDLIRHMKEQEDEHFDYFDEQIKKRQTRPTVMQPVWKVGGFALGFLTAMMGKKAAMTCTTAVEEVIDEHYQEQLRDIENAEKNTAENKKIPTDLKEKIIKFREEELEHRDIGYEHEAANFAGFNPLSRFIKSTTRFAIEVSKKI